MNSEVKKRKKRFWAFCLVFVLMMGNVMSMLAIAAEYTPDDLTNDPENEIGKVNIVNAGDKIAIPSSLSYGTVCYVTEDDYIIRDVVIGSSYEVESYEEVFGDSDSLNEGKGWRIVGNDLNYSSGSFYLTLEEYNYSQSEIHYELNGGDNAASNPSTYYEGKEEIRLVAASREGYTFEGWYSDPACTIPVTAISTTQTGDVTLYAKFISNGNMTPINYEMLDGANSHWMHGSSENLAFRGAGDFSKFTGVKVDGNLVDGSNYSAEEGSTIITLKASYLNTLTIESHTIEILWTDGSAITSFTIDADTSDDDDDDSDTLSGNQALPSDTDKLDDVPKTGESTLIGWLFVLMAVSGAGMIITKRKGKRMN